MAEKTIEGFLRKLERDGLKDYAVNLRAIIAMSRKRKEAVTALTFMTITLLIHLIKFISMPQSRDRNKWRKEVRGYLTAFNIRNKNPKNQPWLSIDYIQKDLNGVLSSAEFKKHMENDLEGYPEKNEILALLNRTKSLKDLEVKLFFDSDNSLKLSIKNQVI
jgi:hypothetical protein